MAVSSGYSEAKHLRDKVGGELGVDAVVGLQALTKPIMTKLTQEAITKHSIIKALNKLYKRNVPVPKKVKAVLDEEGNELNVDASQIETQVSNAQETNVDYSQQVNAEQALTDKQATQNSGPLDFSQSAVESNWNRNQ